MMFRYVYDCMHVVYIMLCLLFIYNYVNNLKARSIFSTSHLDRNVDEWYRKRPLQLITLCLYSAFPI